MASAPCSLSTSARAAAREHNSRPSRSRRRRPPAPAHRRCRSEPATPCIGHNHHRLETTQIAVGPPVLGQFDGSPHELARILFELAFEPLEQGKRVGRRTGKPARSRPLCRVFALFGVRLDHGLPDRHLAVAADRNNPALADGQDGGPVPDGVACSLMLFRPSLSGDLGIHRARCKPLRQLEYPGNP